MPDFPRPLAENGSDVHHDPVTRYTIRRKGSVYNIVGPEGRVFAKYKSASVVGPRWEELTETPWPYPSSAYEPGTRLWQLGLIDRGEVGKTERAIASGKSRRGRINLEDAPEPLTASQENEKAAQSPTAKARPELKPLKAPARQLTLLDQPANSPAQSGPLASPEDLTANEPPQSPAPTGKPEASPQTEPAASSDTVPSGKGVVSSDASQDAKPARRKSAPKASAETPPAKKKGRVAAHAAIMPPPATKHSTNPAHFPSTQMPLALPAPRINLEEQARHIQALRRNPQLLFEPQMRVILQHEVEYHRPYARWAKTLLTMLVRYDKRKQRTRAALDPQTILAKHIAWQEEQLRGASTSR